MATFDTPEERAAYWQGRHDEAADALQHERARVDADLIEGRKWITPVNSETGQPR
jgi:hypothetical protein